MLLALAGALALALGLAACGGDDVADLTELAPAGSLAYGEAVVKPEGNRKDTVEAILERFPRGEEAGERLIEAIDSELADEGLTYEEDIEPWLGERVAGVLIAIGAQPEFAVLAESTDDGAAQELIDKAAEREDGVSEREHGGVSYLSDGETATAVIKGALVIASESGITDVIDAADGESLAGEEAFADLADTDDEVFGFAWVNPDGLLDVATAGIATQDLGLDPEEVRGQLERLGLSDEEPLVARLTAGEDFSAVEVSYERADGAGSAGDGESPGLLGEMPEDSLLALGIAEAFFDAQTEGILAGLELGAAGEGGVSADEALDEVERELGFDVRGAVEGLGGGGAFLRGRGLTDIGAGLALQVTDRDAVERALTALEAQVSEGDGTAGALSPDLAGEADGFSILPAGVPFPITVALTDDRLAIAFGPDAAQRLLDPEDTLEGSDRLADAREALDGLEPALLVDVTSIVGLAETFGLSADPDFQEARPYLTAFRELLAGSGSEGGRKRARFAVSFSA